MDGQLVDFSFVYDMAEGDTKYAYELISLFLNTLSDGMMKLEKLIRQEAPYDEIRFQSHFLKSSAKVVKVRGMFDGFFEIENLARENTGREKMLSILTELVDTFKVARPELEAEVKKYGKLKK